MAPWRTRLHEIIYEADTSGGKTFDVFLLWAILISVLSVSLETVKSLELRFGDIFWTLEVFFTALFSLEYLLRLIAVKRPMAYVFSFYGIIDLLAIVPMFLEPFLAGSQYFMMVRSMRLLRVYRVLKLGRYLGEIDYLLFALKSSKHKILVFLAFVFILACVLGSLMFLVEGEASGFTSIPRGVYWAIVTLTTVGYGDITPQTPVGQLISSFIMILGYGILAVPTGMVTVELSKADKIVSTQSCPECSLDGHAFDAKFCKYCGESL